MIGRCRHRVHWWDIGTTVRCIREHGHEGDHTDGDRWFDNHGMQTPREQRPARTAPERVWLTDEEVRDIRRRAKSGQAVADIARDMAIDYQTTWNCARGNTYRSVA